MKCSKCANDIKEGTVFCPFCGNKFEQSEQNVVNNIESNAVASSTNVTNENISIVSQDAIPVNPVINNTNVTDNINNGIQTETNENVSNASNNTNVVMSSQENINNVNQTNNSNNKKKIIIIAGVVLVLVIALVSILLLLFKNGGIEIDIVYSSNYEDAPYYIEDESVIIDNSDEHVTTSPKTTVAKTRTTKIAYSTIPVSTSVTTRRTATTKRPTTTTTRVVITTTKRPNTTRPTVAINQTTPSTTTTIIPQTQVPTTIQNQTTTIIPNTTSTTTNTTTTNTTTTTTTTSTTTSTSTSTTTQAVANEDKIYDRTVMIYMVGSTLESEDASASRDILEMIQAYSDEYTNIYVYTGGSTYWYLDNISPYTNMIHLVKNGNIYPVRDLGNKNMGDAATLAEFINVVDDSTSTNYYDLILWNHGSGPIFGYGHDMKTNDMLLLYEILNALGSTSFNSERKFEFIGFDACLMSSVEIAYYLSYYTDYLLASEETEFGYGWDYKVFDNASKLSTIELGKKIIDGFAQANIDLMNKYTDYYTPYTLTLTDLTKIDSVVKAINSNFSNLTNAIDSKYEELAYVRLNTIEFGQKTTENSSDLIDIYHFASQYKMNDLADSIKDSVVYSNSNLKNAHGLSMFFPFTEANKEESKGRLEYIYKFFEDFEDYYNFLVKFTDIRYGDVRTKLDINNLDARYKNKSRQLSLKINDKIKNNISMGYYIIFEKCEDGNYMPVFRGNDLRIEGNELVADYNNRILNVIENGDVGTIPVYESKRTNKGTEYITPVVLMDMTDDIVADGGFAKFFIKDESVLFQGILPDTEDDTSDTYENKRAWQLEDWQFVQFANFRYKILDENGHYKHNWESLKDYYLFETSPKKNKVEFKINKLDPAKEYYAVINVVDYQGNVSSTDLIPIK